MRYSLAEVMEGGATAAVDRIEPTTGHGLTVLAVDCYGDYGAAFRFGVDARGQWFADALYAEKEPSGAWLDLGSGGSHGDGWDTPWRPPDSGWDGEPLLVLGSAGLSVESDDGEEQDLLAVFGFAGPHVNALEVADADGKRRVPINSEVGAFVVVHIGRGDFTVTPLAPTGRVGAAHTFS